jgi:hypothetical protein
MLSGIAGLKCKRVKNASQCRRSLFIDAQKSAILASNLCTNGWEKPHTPFVKVAEGSEISNFAIYLKVHFSWKFLR